MRPLALLVSSPTSPHALGLCRAAGTRVKLVFFFQDGVHQVNTNAYPTKGIALAEQWHDCLSNTSITAVACVTSALSRGVLDADQADQLNRHPTLTDGVVLGGLGELADALDRYRVVSIK